jgi:2-haloacid dehalogenase
MPQANAHWMCRKPSVLVFDVNETLIDIEWLNPVFERAFGDKRFMREWFNHLIMYSMTITLSGLYKDFWTLGAGVLQMVGRIHHVDIKPEDVEALQNGMKTMLAHPDCEEGLNMLKEAGFRMVTLTNSPPTPGSRSPLENAGLDRFFERQFNVQAARAYKPDPAVYHMVAQELDVVPADCCMVASHVWDTIGGQSLGMAGALITRHGNAPLPVPGLPQPNAVGSDLPSLAREMIRMWRP